MPRSLHVYTVSLNADPVGHWSLLSPDELDRANRFVFRRDRDRYVVARASLRTLLARYLDIDARDVCFTLGPYGKPSLANPRSEELRFNLAHSADVAVIAMTRGHDVGIDVEHICADRADAAVAERFFAPAELNSLRAYHGSAWAAAFFACWTRKEAFVKARGEGLSFPLQTFDVSIDPAASAVSLCVHDNDVESARWSLRSLSVAPGYAAALAFEAADCQVHQCLIA